MNTRRLARCTVPLAAICLVAALPPRAVAQQKEAAPPAVQADGPEVAKRKLQEAEVAFEQIVASQQKLVELYPAEPRYRRELVNTYIYLAQVQYQSGRPAVSEATYKSAIGLLEALAAEAPNSAEVQQFLAQSYAWLGTEQLRTNRATEAKPNLQLAVAVLEKLIKSHPQAGNYQDWLAPGYYYLALAERATGAVAEALEHQLQTIEIYRKSAERNPIAKSQLAGAFSAFGDTLAMSARWQEAAEAYAAAISADDRVRVYRTRRAILQWAAEDADGYRASCADLIERFGKIDAPLEAIYVAQACLVGDGALPDMSPVVELAQRAVESSKGSPLAKSILGAAQLSAGQNDEGIATLKATLPQLELAATLVPAQRDALRITRLIAEHRLALAYERQGDREALEAQIKSLRKLLELMRESTPPTNDVLPAWSLPLAVTIADRDLAKLTGAKAAE